MVRYPWLLGEWSRRRDPGPSPRRLHPVGAIGGEIVGGEDVTGGCGDLGGDGAFVEGAAALLLDRLQGGRQIGAAQHRPRRRRCSLRVERGGRGLALHHRCDHPQVVGELLRHREPVAAERDRGGEMLGAERSGAVLGGEPHPAIDTARNGDRLRSPIGHDRVTGGAQLVGVEAGTAAPRGVEDLGAVPSRPVHQSEQVAPDPACGGKHHPQHCIGRDHRIRRIAPGLHHLERSLGGQMMRSDGDGARAGVSGTS
jgi:hypothetical protein